jgi:hypothetical protein
VEEAAHSANTETLWRHTEDAEMLYAKLGWVLQQSLRDRNFMQYTIRASRNFTFEWTASARR